MFLNFALLVLGFVILVKGADFLVSGAASFAKRLNISELAIGLSVVAFGTSAPELVVNLISNANGYKEVVFGNIIGSNVFNLSAILGIAGIIYPLSVQSETVKKEIPFSFLILILLVLLGNDSLFFDGATNVISLLDGLILLGLFVLFLVYIFMSMKSGANTATAQTEELTQFSPVKTGVFIVLGLVGLVFGGQLVVNNAVTIAEYFNLSQKLIGLTIVAAGTSLPELATSAVAAYKKKADIAVGNIIGSNIFNILLVLGATALMDPLNYEASINFDIGVVAALTILLFLAMFTGKRRVVDRWEALILLFVFMGYMSYLLIINLA